MDAFQVILLVEVGIIALGQLVGFFPGRRLP